MHYKTVIYNLIIYNLCDMIKFNLESSLLTKINLKIQKMKGKYYSKVLLLLNSMSKHDLLK